MAVDGTTIRKVVLEVCRDYSARGPGYFQSGPVLKQAAQRLSLRTENEEQALLTVWYDLFRMGVLAWGFNLANSDPPFIHMTDVGRHSLENLSRDPYNPDGYMAAVRPHIAPGSVAESYLQEAVGTFAGGFLKSTAVMVGAAAESLVLDLRDALVKRLGTLGHSVPKKLNDWRVKAVRDALGDYFAQNKNQLGQKLGERFYAFWTPMTDQVRLARNDAGHPASIAPVTHETVHAALLLFPELASLTKDLQAWVDNDLK